MTATIFLNEQIVPFELDALTFIFTFAYFELHMLSQKLNQQKPQEEGVEHQNQFDACFLQLLLLWPINHGQPLPAQRVVVTWPKSNSYQIFGGSDYCYVLLLWTTWWRVVRELENVSRGKTFYPTSPIYLSSVCPTWHAKKSENTFLLPIKIGQSCLTQHEV